MKYKVRGFLKKPVEFIIEAKDKKEAIQKAYEGDYLEVEESPNILGAKELAISKVEKINEEGD